MSECPKFRACAEIEPVDTVENGELKMRDFVKFAVCSGAFLTMSATAALAGGTVGVSAPIAEGGLLGLAAAGVIGGIWIARRKR